VAERLDSLPRRRFFRPATRQKGLRRRRTGFHPPGACGGYFLAGRNILKFCRFHSTPRSNRRNAAETLSQQNKILRPILIEGILPDVRQLCSVRLDTGNRRNISAASMKSGVVLAGIVCFSVSLIISICERTMRSR